MLHSISTIRPTGRTIYVYPDGTSLADWTTKRVLMGEGTGVNTGRYKANIDDSIDTLWRAFEGASQPGSWSASFEYFDLKPTSLIVTPSVGLGVDVTTRALVLPIDATYTIVRVVLDSNGNQVTLPGDCKFVLTDGNELPIAEITPSINGAAYTVVIPRNLTTRQRAINFALRDPPSNVPLDYGTIQFTYAATSD